MPRKQYKAEEIIHKLREAEVLAAQGHKPKEIARQIGVSVQTYYRWRKEYGVSLPHKLVPEQVGVFN